MPASKIEGISVYAGGVTISDARVSRMVLLQYANVLLGAWMASRTPGRLR